MVRWSDLLRPMNTFVIVDWMDRFRWWALEVLAPEGMSTRRSVRGHPLYRYRSRHHLRRYPPLCVLQIRFPPCS